MSEELIVKNCSPTLAGMKSASMFSYKFSSPEALTCDLRELNRKLVSKGLVFIPIRVKNDSALIDIYLNLLKRGKPLEHLAVSV